MSAERGGARDASARQSRILRATSGSVIEASARMRPPHAGQQRASTSKTRFNRSAQAIRADRGGLRSHPPTYTADFGDAGPPTNDVPRSSPGRMSADSPAACVRRQHSVIADLTATWRRDQRRQPFEQLALLHHDMRRPVSPERLCGVPPRFPATPRLGRRLMVLGGGGRQGHLVLSALDTVQNAWCPASPSMRTAKDTWLQDGLPRPRRGSLLRPLKTETGVLS